MENLSGKKPPPPRLTPSRVRRASFFQLVRLLCDVSWGKQASSTGLALPGIRFKSDPSLAFPVSDVSRVDTVQEGGERYHVITCTFMGLCGAGSPLPVAYVKELAAEGNEVVRDFLDIANHRLIELFFRSWQRYRYLFQYAGDGTDALSSLLLALTGHHRDELDAMTPFSPRFLIYWSGLLAQRPASARALQTILRSTVHPGIRIEECVLRRVRIPGDQTFRLSARRSRLNRNVTIGRSVLDRTGKFRVWVTSVTSKALIGFLPGGDRLELMDRIIALVLRSWLDYDVALVLTPGTMVGMAIGRQGGARLHLTSWLGRPRGPNMTLIIQGAPGEARSVRVAGRKGV